MDLPWLRLAAKPLPALLLAAWVFGRGRHARLVAAGLALSALGDLLLELDWFLGGMTAFAAAHVAYIAGFLAVTRRPRLALLVPYAGWAVAMYALLRSGLGALEAPVAVYSGLLALMMWRAAAPVGTAPRRWPAAVGALLFGLSDLLIGIDRFRTPVPGARVWIMLLYWAGQGGIAMSAATPFPPPRRSS